MNHALKSRTEPNDTHADVPITPWIDFTCVSRLIKQSVPQASKTLTQWSSLEREQARKNTKRGRQRDKENVFIFYTIPISAPRRTVPNT